MPDLKVHEIVGSGSVNIPVACAIPDILFAPIHLNYWYHGTMYLYALKVFVSFPGR